MTEKSRKSPLKRQGAFASIFSHPDFRHVFVPPSVRELHPFGACAFVDFTTGMEFHQTPKIFFDSICF